MRGLGRGIRALASIFKVSGVVSTEGIHRQNQGLNLVPKGPNYITIILLGPSRGP